MSGDAPVAAGVLACRRAVASRPADRTHVRSVAFENFLSLSQCGRRFRAAGRAPSTSGGTPDATVVKHQIPNSKLQRNFKPQAPNQGVKRTSGGLEFGVWCFSGAWNLEFGYFFETKS